MRTLAMMAVCALAFSVSAQAMPHQPDPGVQRVEQTRATKDVVAIAAPAVAVERAQLVASPASLDARAQDRPGLEMALVGPLAVSAGVAVVAALHTPSASAHERLCCSPISTAKTSTHSLIGTHAEQEAEGHSAVLLRA
jgi:hypothetical protein